MVNYHLSGEREILGRHSHDGDKEEIEADGGLMASAAQLTRTAYLVYPCQRQPAGKEKRQSEVLSMVRHLEHLFTTESATSNACIPPFLEPSPNRACHKYFTVIIREVLN